MNRFRICVSGGGGGAGDVEASRQGKETPGNPETAPVSAPRLFPVAFNLMKPYITEETRRKVVILGGEWEAPLKLRA